MYRIAHAAVLFSLVPASGCFIPFLSIPVTAPGYGQTYRVVDGDGRPVPEGVLFLASAFPSGKGGPSNCYAIADGKVDVPSKTMQKDWMAPMAPQPPFVFFFGWENPKQTRARILAPGMVMAEFTIEDLARGPIEIRLWPADPALENRILTQLLIAESAAPWDTESDKKARAELVDYIQQRQERLKMFYGDQFVASGVVREDESPRNQVSAVASKPLD